MIYLCGKFCDVVSAILALSCKRHKDTQTHTQWHRWTLYSSAWVTTFSSRVYIYVTTTQADDLSVVNPALNCTLNPLINCTQFPRQCRCQAVLHQRNALYTVILVTIIIKSHALIHSNYLAFKLNATTQHHYFQRDLRQQLPQYRFRQCPSLQLWLQPWLHESVPAKDGCQLPMSTACAAVQHTQVLHTISNTKCAAY